MTSLAAVTAWVQHYRRAWESNDPDDVGDLFADDAAYFTEPYAEPWLGRQRIVAEWLKRKDEPGTTRFEWRPVVVTDQVAIVEATTHYPDKVFSNLWVLRLDHAGQARHFTEWWMEHPHAD
jgi:uncharacterized protein (TIGR02246 family)